MSYRYSYAAFYSFIWNEQIQLFTGLLFSCEKREEKQITCKCGNLIIVHTKNNNKIYLKVLFRMADFKTCDTYTTG